jgi:hypothetical protein
LKHLLFVGNFDSRWDVKQIENKDLLNPSPDPTSIQGGRTAGNAEHLQHLTLEGNSRLRKGSEPVLPKTGRGKLKAEAVGRKWMRLLRMRAI